jgi:hypothetical protein
LHSPSLHAALKKTAEAAEWPRFVACFLATFIGGIGAIFTLVLLVDPYAAFPFSLPIERRIVSANQRHMYPLIIRSGHFDSVITGTSTSRLLDPEILNVAFDARFANLSMNSLVAWEQQRVLAYFQRRAGSPKVLIIGLDDAWCDPNAPDHGIYGFPDWLYDDDPWNDLPNLLNMETVLVSGRHLAFNLGLYPERIRLDGFKYYLPPDSRYDSARARQNIRQWPSRHQIGRAAPAEQLSQAERQSLSLRGLDWLDAILAGLPAATVKVLSHMPRHISVHPRPGTREAAVDQECKNRIEQIARKHRATVVDWNYASPITTVDDNYWDPLHFRLPIAERIARGLAAVVLEGRASEDGSYRITVR